MRVQHEAGFHFVQPSLRHFTDFADEAARMRDETIRRYGLNPNQNLQVMALSRKQALERLEGLERQVVRHLDEHIPATIGEAPTAVPHWRKELNGFLTQMESLTVNVGKKTSSDWSARNSELRRRVIDLLGEE